MKKLLYSLLALAAAVGCSKDAQVVTPGAMNGAVNFVITDDLTRSAGHKTAWVDDDRVAIFLNKTGESYQYAVNEPSSDDGVYTLTACGEVLMSTNEVRMYSIFYPYVSGKTYEEYLTFADQDVLAVELTIRPDDGTVADADIVTVDAFTHMNSYITVSLPELEVGAAEHMQVKIYADEVLKKSYSAVAGENSIAFYATPVLLQELKKYTLQVELEGSICYTFEAYDSSITSWDSGMQYAYSTRSSCDLRYDTSNRVCEIYTAVGLEAFRCMVVGEDLPDGAVVMGINTDEMKVPSLNAKLMTNINLENEDWTPIGSSEEPYHGVFDGNGFEVRYLRVDRPSDKSVGLFAAIEGATIKNLGVTGSITGSAHTGGIAGSAMSSTITNCYNKATVTAFYRVGGLIGYIGVTNGESTITGCYNAGTVSFNVGGSDYSYIGGIVGYAEAKINWCYNIGEITAENKYCGGIVGYAFNDEVINCYNVGAIYGPEYVGGIAGCLEDASVYNSYNVGAITSTDLTAAGIVGFRGDNKIINCYSTGAVTAKLGSGNELISAIAGGESDFSGDSIGDSIGDYIINCYCLDDVSLYTNSGVAYITATDFESLTTELTDKLNSADCGFSGGNCWVSVPGSSPTLTGVLYE